MKGFKNLDKDAFWKLKFFELDESVILEVFRTLLFEMLDDCRDCLNDIIFEDGLFDTDAELIESHHSCQNCEELLAKEMSLESFLIFVMESII